MPRDKSDLENLAIDVRSSHRIVNAVAIAVVASYVVWFWMFNRYGPSHDSQTWAHFGDYIGGLLGPLVAYFAFYWLTRSVSLQKQELADTRAALQDSSASQERQANSAQVSVRVAALSALINSIMGEVQIQRMQIQFILDQAASHPTGAASTLHGGRLSAREIPDYLRDLNQTIADRMNQRFDYEEELKQLLQESRRAI